jgi:uncharacterized protein
MRIVAETNTLVSGFGWGGPPGQVVDAVLSGQVTLVTSPALLGELARVLAYPKLAAIVDDPAALLAAVAEAADAVDPAERVTVLADEPDNRVLEAAAAGRAVDDPDVQVLDEEQTRVRAWVRPMPMWWSFPPWRRVTVPLASTWSPRTRSWASAVRSPGAALGRAA